MLHVLTRENAQFVLTNNAKALPLPWLLIRDSLFAFGDKLRASGIFFASASDSDTANAIAPLLLQQKKSVAVGVGGGTLEVLHYDAAAKLLSGYAAETFGAKWVFMQDHVFKFLKHLYTQNVFIAQADAGALAVVRKSESNNLVIRLKAGA